MMTLCLIRHTRPDIGPGICYGRLDIDVADGFDADAARIRSMLPATDLIVSSPLRRTRKLAEYLAPDCGFTLDDRLMEKHFGIWEGLAWDQIERRQIDAWAADLMDYAPPEGESARQLMARTESLLCDLAKLPQQNIALVAHGGSIRALLALIANIPLADTLNWDIDYGSVIFVKIHQDEP